jgi:hypothetical protein
MKKILSMLTISFLILTLSPNIFAQENFEKDIVYDIYYEVSTYEVDIIKGVKVIGITEIGEKKFLEIYPSGLGGKEKKGYILLDTVKAILPSNYIGVDRSFRGNISP